MIRVSPCLKESCMFFGTWSVKFWEPVVRKKKWWHANDNTPQWAIKGTEACMCCEHFKGFNLFKKEG